MPQKSAESNASCMIKRPGCPEPRARAVIIQSVYLSPSIRTSFSTLFRSRSFHLVEVIDCCWFGELLAPKVHFSVKKLKVAARGRPKLRLISFCLLLALFSLLHQVYHAVLTEILDMRRFAKYAFGFISRRKKTQSTGLMGFT